MGQQEQGATGTGGNRNRGQQEQKTNPLARLLAEVHEVHGVQDGTDNGLPVPPRRVAVVRRVRQTARHRADNARETATKEHPLTENLT